jgi:hypothetical protein
MIEMTMEASPPDQIVAAIEEGCEELKVSLITDAFFTNSNSESKSVGGLDPEDGILYINLQNALHDTKFMKKGALYVPSVFFNLLHAVFHDIFHANQIEHSTKLKEMPIVPEELDIWANQYAAERCLIWVNENKLPSIEEMGWCGEKIIELISNLYYKHTDHITKELEGIEVGAAAELNDLFQYCEFSERGKSNLIELIEVEGRGTTSNNYKFITAVEFFGLDEVNPAALTENMQQKSIIQEEVSINANAD